MDVSKSWFYGPLAPDGSPTGPPGSPRKSKVARGRTALAPLQGARGLVARRSSQAPLLVLGWAWLGSRAFRLLGRIFGLAWLWLHFKIAFGWISASGFHLLGFGVDLA